MLAIDRSVAAYALGSCEGVNRELGSNNPIQFGLLADRLGTCQILYCLITSSSLCRMVWHSDLAFRHNKQADHGT